jgi:hypothetical protein
MQAQPTYGTSLKSLSRTTRSCSSLALFTRYSNSPLLPDDVKLYPLPPEVVQKVPQARSHMFFVKDDEAILVSSSDRRVIKKKSTD